MLFQFTCLNDYLLNIHELISTAAIRRRSHKQLKYLPTISYLYPEQGLVNFQTKIHTVKFQHNLSIITV